VRVCVCVRVCVHVCVCVRACVRASVRAWRALALRPPHAADPCRCLAARATCVGLARIGINVRFDHITCGVSRREVAVLKRSKRAWMRFSPTLHTCRAWLLAPEERTLRPGLAASPPWSSHSCAGPAAGEGRCWPDLHSAPHTLCAPSPRPASPLSPCPISSILPRLSHPASTQPPRPHPRPQSHPHALALTPSHPRACLCSCVAPTAERPRPSTCCSPPTPCLSATAPKRGLTGSSSGSAWRLGLWALLRAHGTPMEHASARCVWLCSRCRIARCRTARCPTLRPHASVA